MSVTIVCNYLLLQKDYKIVQHCSLFLRCQTNEGYPPQPSHCHCDSTDRHTHSCRYLSEQALKMQKNSYSLRIKNLTIPQRKISLLHSLSAQFYTSTMYISCLYGKRQSYTRKSDGKATTHPISMYTFYCKGWK